MTHPILNSFKTITLNDLQRVELMNRVDAKFLVREDLLNEILAELQVSYFALEINGNKRMNYTTVYFDTADDRMFTEHHNGKLNRYKVRKRLYVDTKIAYIEVKFKNNKGKNVKKRIKTNDDLYRLTDSDMSFLRSSIPFVPEDLKPKIRNNFSRMTLANKDFTERCTIDTDLSFFSSDITKNIADAVIIEVKKDSEKTDSFLVNILKEKGIHKEGFSKYCFGRILSDSTLKYNRFKPKIRYVERILNTIIL